MSEHKVNKATVVHNRDVDPDDRESEDWNPTSEVLQAFMVRDFELAQSNVQQAMTRPMTVRELKECTLHSQDVIERVLSSKIASGLVSESKGKYTLVRA